jgi:hypothetical protein
MRFNVTVRRSESRVHTFYIEADDRETAFKRGLESAYNHDFHEDSVDESNEEVEDIVEVK